ncbi:MAG: acyltransferase family protein [Bdellovibrio sp.]|nr:acyltransferase family protein [Bdellovibrio sp.]
MKGHEHLPNVQIEGNEVIDKIRQGLDLLARYHHHEVKNLDVIPKQGPVLVIINHSLATYDGFLLGKAIVEGTGRMPRGLGDDLLFDLPYLQDWCWDVGLVPASPRNALELLQRGELVALAPGGMRESLRSSKDRYKVLWQDRKGFVRLALEAQVPVILAACPMSDRIFKVYDSPWTKQIYELFHFPFPLFRGMGPTLLPRPVKLTHFLKGPFFPELRSGELPEDAVHRLHKQLIAEMETLLTSRDPKPQA